jgi:hypothetical protein
MPCQFGEEKKGKKRYGKWLVSKKWRKKFPLNILKRCSYLNRIILCYNKMKKLKRVKKGV